MRRLHVFDEVEHIFDAPAWYQVVCCLAWSWLWYTSLARHSDALAGNLRSCMRVPRAGVCGSGDLNNTRVYAGSQSPVEVQQLRVRPHLRPLVQVHRRHEGPVWQVPRRAGVPAMSGARLQSSPGR